MRRIVAILRVALMCGALVAPALRAAPPEAAAVWPTAGWPTSTPEAEGMSSSALAALVDLGRANAMDSLLVTRHGRIVAEAFYAPYRAGLRHALNSATKGVVGTLTGIALQRGALDRLDRPVLELLAGRDVANADARKRSITVQHLLDMNSGLAWTEPLTGAPVSAFEMERSDDWAAYVADRPMARAPGEAFDYNSGNSQLLSALLGRIGGGSTLAFAQRELFAPLGIADVAWRQDPQRVPIGGYGLYLAPRDMAKIGYLYLRQGRWEDRQLLPPGWTQRIAEATLDMKLGSTPTFRYANGWWSVPERRLFMAVGNHRQLIMVLPDLDLVVVTTGTRNYPFIPLIDAIVAAAPSNTPLAPDADAQAQLAEHIARAAEEPRTPVRAAPPAAQRISGRSVAFAANRMGLRSLRLDLVLPRPGFELVLDGARPGAPPQRVAGAVGLDGLFSAPETVAGRLLASKGRWLDERRFEVTARWLADGLIATYTLDFGEDAVTLRYADNHGVTAEIRGAP